MIPRDSRLTRHPSCLTNGVHLSSRAPSGDSRIKAGEKIDWPVVRRGSAGRGYHTRLEIQTLERLREGAARSEVNANIFFMAALRDYVRKHSLENHI